MANLGVFPGLGPTRAEFDNNTVLNAVNPDPVLGYAHGPIPDNNPGWKPAAYTAALAGGACHYNIKVADITATPPPNLAVVLNKENTGVCDVVVNPPAQMCGLVFSEGPALRRHLRNEHSGAVVNPDRRAKTQAEIIASQNAIKRWVLEGGWRDASYLHEPGRGPDNGLVGHWASALERIAATDVQFAAQYGTRFHRWQTPATPTSGYRSRRRGPDVPGNPILFAGIGLIASGGGGGDVNAGGNPFLPNIPNLDKEAEEAEEEAEEEEQGELSTSSSPSAFQSL